MYSDVLALRDFLKLEYVDEVDRTSAFLSTFAAFPDPPESALRVCALIGQNACLPAGVLYRKCLDVLDVKDPAVLVVSVTILECALEVPGADVVLMRDLSADDPIAVRAAAAAMIACAQAAAEIQGVSPSQLLTSAASSHNGT